MTKETIKSFHINESLAPTGGAERYIISIYQALRESGNPAILIYGREEPGTFSTPSEEGFLVSGVHSTKSQDKTRAALTQLATLIERHNPNLIHFHSTFNAEIVNEVADVKPSIKTAHDSRLVCPIEFRTKVDGSLCQQPAGDDCLVCMGEFGIDETKAVARLSETLQLLEATKRMAHVITPSSYMREQLIMNGIPKEKIVVIPHFLLNENSIDDPFEEDASIEHDILFVGRLIPSKGLDRLLQATSMLPYKASLIVAGDGPDLNKYKGRAVELGLQDQVTFAGWIPSEALDTFYRKSKVVAIPSLGPESFGLIGLEAMAFAKPVVAFDSGGIAEWLIDGKNGFLVTRGDTQLLAERIGRLMSNEDLANQMGRNGYEILKQRFSKSSHLEKLLEIYKKVTN